MIYSTDAGVSKRGLRRNGILESVQAFSTPTAPTPRVVERRNISVGSQEKAEKLQPLKSRVALKTSFSLVNNDHPMTSVDSGIQKSTNGPQNLVSYSLDPPNSFPQPTSIPPIDTLSATWPTPMGSIEKEFSDMDVPVTVPPITNEMSNVEAIPGIEGISTVERIPLEFAEESPWERSHAMSGSVISSHALHSNASDTQGVQTNLEKLVPVKKENGAENGRKRKTIFGKPQGRKVFFKSRPVASKFERKRERNSNKNNESLAYSKLEKRVFIPPPLPIDPIQPLLKDLLTVEPVSDIAEHVVDFETIKPLEAIDKHLLAIKTHPEIGPIKEHLKTEQLDAIEPIENHQIKAKRK